VQGGFSGAGLALFQSLAARGAQVIALHPSPATPTILQLVLLLRETSGNERLYADECDMADMGSIRSFVKRWEKDARGGMVQDLEARIEAVVFCDGEGAGLEGQGIGLGRQTVDDAGTLERYHSSLLLSRHCLVQLLLPTLLRSATHSPVRIVNQVSPFYAARPLNLSDLDYSTRKYPTRQPWLAEGQSSLGSIALFRELQARVNESKNSGAGLAIVSVCGGFTRSTFRHALRADSRQPHFSWVGFLVYCALFPFIFLFAKSAAEASEGLLAAVLGSVKRADVPVVLGEAVEEDRPKIDVDGKVRKGQGEKEREPMRVRGGAVYREGREVRYVRALSWLIR
jgi:NAD(P)-dependent dehydrogenase (short-subunit alcohol dehydrogenase family)